MLCVMKRKVKSSVSEESSRQSGGTLPLEDSPMDVVKTPIISNVPNSISVPSAQIPPSSNSSISSEGLHIMAPLTRVSDDETTSGFRLVVNTEDSPVESSVAGSKKVASTDGSAGSATQKRPYVHAFTRNVSASDLDENESTQDASKKRKILPSVRLLAMPEDSSALNSLHAFCRMQIEVFAATPVDMAQPAPGRKAPIKLHQVGLRCIHCRHLTSRDRVKRAVCYPRSVSRIYHSVSDMKFDHFTQCRGFSPELRAKFQELKQECKRRSNDRKEGNGGGPTSSTAQYYHDAASKMGLVNSKENDGIFMSGQVLDHSQLPASVTANEAVRPKPPAKMSGEPPAAATNEAPLVCGILPSQASSANQPSFPVGFPATSSQVLALYQNLQNCGGPFFLPNRKVQPPLMHSANMSAFTAHSKSVPVCPPLSSDKLCLLAMPEDPSALNGLHCFVRRNVEVFIATKKDAAAPSPGRRTRVKVGQVGLRCIHCAQLPLKDRVKRAVCYPPAVSGIYHSVSNMKFDHFGSCKGLSPEARVEFEKLKSSSGHRNTPGSNGSRGASSSTAQYYEQSAARLGLIDTEGGIQFCNQEANMMASTGGQSATDGISALMIAATNPTVRAEFDRRKALSSGTLGAVASV